MSRLHEKKFVHRGKSDDGKMCTLRLREPKPKNPIRQICKAGCTFVY